MSTRNNINRIANTLAEKETALNKIRESYPKNSTQYVETKLAAFAEVVRNTRRKMVTPAGFEWALHTKFNVLAINDTHITVEVVQKLNNESVRINIPRSDLSLSMWQVTSHIRKLSADLQLENLKTVISDKQKTVTKIQKELDATQKRLETSKNDLTEAEKIINKRVARNQKIQTKREKVRARRKLTVVKI